jgi:dienelactone hydrolase
MFKPVVRLALLQLFAIVTMSSAQLTVTFPSRDSLQLTADWYPVEKDLPVILLCHQNRFSRGEYIETAVKLNKFGFNCLALDQRVGDEINGIRNETAARARQKGLKPTFADAEQDIQAAIDFLYEKYNRKVILMGSSYSASLVLKIAATNPKVLAVIAFSPGEYFDDKHFVSNSISGLTKPVFVTSTREEAPKVTQLMQDVNARLQVQFIPKSKGVHGTRVLWNENPDRNEFWVTLMSFLNRLKKIAG